MEEDTYPIADLHCHPSLKPLRDPVRYPSIWKSGKNRKASDYFNWISPRKWAINSALKKMANYSQSNLNSCLAGNNRLLFVSVYPFERAFLKPDRPFSRASKIHKNILQKIIFRKRISEKSRKIDVKVGSLLTGSSRDWLRPIINDIHNTEKNTLDYYNEYIMARDYIFDNQGFSTNTATGISQEFKMVHNYEELIAHQSNDTICGIYTVEGMHSYVEYRKEDLFAKHSIDEIDAAEQLRLKDAFISRINADRANQKTPFFITFSHHFNNLLAGHAASFSNSLKTLMPGFNVIFDQNPGLDRGISTIGMDLIKNCLLSRSDGPRILIDTKHMSLLAREQYYEYINPFNKHTDIHKHIPVICSHTAVSGIETLIAAKFEKDDRINEMDSYVSRYDINLTNEDISEIYKSHGLIGICMHDGRMPGGRFRKLLLKKHKSNKDKIKKLHVQMFMTNVFHIVRVVSQYIKSINNNSTTEELKREAWKIISLGSDNDGIVDPFDHYNTASKLKEFKKDCIYYIQHYSLPEFDDFKVVKLRSELDEVEEFMSAEDLEELKFGQSAQQIANRIFYDNTAFFLSTYYTHSYLTNENSP